MELLGRSEVLVLLNTQLGPLMLSLFHKLFSIHYKKKVAFLTFMGQNQIVFTTVNPLCLPYS